jgi:hypothetical protein
MAMNAADRNTLVIGASLTIILAVIVWFTL